MPPEPYPCSFVPGSVARICTLHTFATHDPPAQSLATLHWTHVPAPLQTLPPLSVHAVPREGGDRALAAFVDRDGSLP